MFVESQRMHILNTCKVREKTWSVVLLNKKIHTLLSQLYCVWQVVKTPTIISYNPVNTHTRTIESKWNPNSKITEPDRP